MSPAIRFDDDVDEERPRKLRTARRPAPRVTAAGKTSYESSADVQRWLRQHAPQPAEGRPQFNPMFLTGKRDRLWILSSLGHFHERDLIRDVLHDISSGKEASVYCCVAGPAGGAELLAAKVYRPRIFRSLSNDALYRENRARLDERGQAVRGRRREQKASGGSTRLRARATSAWIEYEYHTQELIHAAGADVPRPVAQIGNAILMGYVGVVDQPAPRLHEVRLDPVEAQRLWLRLIGNVERFLACHRIHGDLSAYNVLYWEGEATVIDFAQAVDPREAADVFPLLLRDIERLYRYFARYGVEADPAALARSMWERYLVGKLEAG